MKDAIVRFDTRVTALVQKWPKWLHVPMLVITNSGQPLIMILIALGICLVAWQHSNLQTVYTALAGVAAIGANSILKHYIHRTRPDTLYVSNMYFKTSSFPSGHAFASAVTLTTLAYLATTYLVSPWAVILPIICALGAVAISISRVYLGAHFPTDVIAGSLLGALTAWGSILIFSP
ncbi:MAG TPA: phosphatase PAP2 family protein [Candidatus Saccharimonadales bacterium]|nr:phosphatase PAP2 family protein [Candidatus Saccharimonadales bacterium]